MRVTKLFGGPRLLQYVSMCSGSLSAISVGVNTGWPSPYLPYLLDPEISHIPTTPEQGSWCAVMTLVGAPVGALLAAFMVDKIGRKKMILSMAPIAATCFILMAYAQDIVTICVARFFIGSTEGAVYTALPMYFGEIAEPSIRGFISSSIPVAALLGTIFINVIGPFLSIKTSSLICALIPIIHFATFIWMPESPYYLLKKGCDDEAKKNLARFRGVDDVNVELKEIAAAVKRQESTKACRFVDLVTVPSIRKASIIYMILSFSNKFSGKTPFLFYTTIIFREAGGDVDPVISVIIFNVVSLFATILAISVIDRFGRRPLMIFSGFGCTGALVLGGIYFTAQTLHSDLLPYLTWMPLTSLISYNIIFSLGLSFGPVLFLSELFPTTIKAKALCVGDSSSAVMGTIASKFFQMATDAAGMYVPFWTFAVCTIFGSICICLFVPETKGKTLEAIQLELVGSTQDKKEVP